MQLLGSGLHEQADFPVAGVIAQRDGRAVVSAEPAGGAEQEELAAIQFIGPPAHADVLAPAEQVAARSVPQKLLGERQRPGGAGGTGANIEEGGIGVEEG